jgi:4-aminobutyrate aminotransferase/(S)-3-amino-2-methylpropionate transaminase
MDSVHPSGLGGTYGGNPVACAAAIGAIKTMKEMNLNARALEIEKLMLDRLKKMQAKFDVIGDIRGRGAMIAIEMVKSGTLEPNSEITSAVAKGCHSVGVLVLTAGTYGNVIRFLPPLTMSNELILEALDVVEEQFAKATKA